MEVTMSRQDADLHIRLPLELLEQAREKAKRDGVELSTVLRALLAFWVRGQVLQTRFPGAILGDERH